MKKEILEWIFCAVIALILAILFRFFVGTLTIVKQRSMYPTLEEGQRLILNRTFRITKKEPQKGDIITFEAPSKKYDKYEANQENPIAVYDNESNGIINKFIYYCVEINKFSYIKRVVATSGDSVKIENGKVHINGVELAEEYLKEDVVTESDVFYDFTVPEGYIFAMGDNRSHSMDCRDVGCIPIEKVEGIAILRVWPFDKIMKF